MLKNDLGNTEDEACGGGFIEICSWSDVQSWSRELQKRRARATAHLTGKAEGDWTAADRTLQAWTNSAEVRAMAAWRNDQFGWPEVEDVENLKQAIKEGDGYLAEAKAVVPDRDEESAPDYDMGEIFKWAAGLASIALAGKWLLDRGRD